MASYFEWNEAIANFFADGLNHGDTYYLSVDDETLIGIGALNFEQDGFADAVQDFETAVRKECVNQVNRRVMLPSVTPGQAGGAPSCLAFLGAMVLAAHRMAPEDDIAEINYFTRLREILGMTGERGRPPGLRPSPSNRRPTPPPAANAPRASVESSRSIPAPEEDCWVALNNWILRNGWQPSAERGPDGPLKFTNYPLSQSLLRAGDREKLEKDFRNAENDLGKDSDREQVGAWFFNRATAFATHHVRKLALEATTDRHEAIVDAVYDVYASVGWDQQVRDGSTPASRRSSSRLMAGLYRVFDPLFDTITYHLFPRRQSKGTRMRLSVMRNGMSEPLKWEQDGQFRPLWPVSPNGGETYQVIGDLRTTELNLPPRNFWILTRDRYGDASGTFASRGSPRLGETFLLLCREEYQEQLHILKEEGLLDWGEGPIVVPDYDKWTEYRECMVLSASWEGIIPQRRELFDELRPRSRASISLQGGLKPGRRDTWLEGYLPHLSITSFDPTWRVKIQEISRPDDEPVLDDIASANNTIELPSLPAGDYSIEVYGNSGRLTDRRYIRILSWDALKRVRKFSLCNKPYVHMYILTWQQATPTHLIHCQYISSCIQ